MNDNSKINVLIGDDTAEFGVRLASALRKSGIYAYTRRNNGNVVLESILKGTPDVAVLDLSMAEMDAVMVMRKAKELLAETPAFVVVSDIENSFIERQAVEGGAFSYMVKPVKEEKLLDAIRSVCRKSGFGDMDDIEIMVTDVIHSLGIPAHIKGYHYLRTAIIDSIRDASLMESVTKQLYPIVAEQHRTTSSRVERAIRHAIEIAWERGNSENIRLYFGYAPGSYGNRPTNSEFIALISDRLRLKLKAEHSGRFPA